MKPRKSFILHFDSLEILDELTDEQAGQLFKAIKSNRNGENLEVSQLVKIALSPFKSQFLRDDEKYSNIVNRNGINGSKGGRPKNPKKPKEPSGLIDSPDKPRKAVSVSDSVSDSDSVSKSDSEVQKTHVESKPQRAEAKYSPEDLASAEYMFSTLVEKQPEMRKPNLISWAAEIRKMREIDKLCTNQMGEVWNWARNDSFWASNILSAKKFREKYQQLLARMRQPQSTVYQTTNEKNAVRMAEVRNLDTARNF